MKLIAKYIKHLFNTKSQAEATFLIENYRHTQMLEELDCDKVYSIEIKEAKSKRSLEQNRLLWAMLHELEKESHEPALDWYIKALDDTGAIVEYLWGMEKAEDGLKKAFRAVRRIKPYKIGKSDGWLFRVVVGSSKMNIEEMNRLIDTVLRYCAEMNINVEEYRE